MRPRLKGLTGNAIIAGLTLGLSAAPGLAQTPAAPPPQQEAPKAPAAPSEPAKPAESPGGEIREIQPLPVLRLKGQSTWDDGFAALKKAIASLESEATRLSLSRAGNPMVYFVDSDDIGFTYEAMVTLGAPPAPGLSLGKEFDAAQSPGGRAVVFNHEGAYDEIDTAYEALTAWLDDKNLVSNGRFLEEYLFIPEKSDETTMKLKIVVFLK